MKLLFIANYVPYFLSHRMDLTAAALEAGFDVSIAVPHHPDINKISRLPVKVLPYNMVRTGMNPLEMCKAIGELRGFIAAEKPDIVHNLPLKCCLYGNLALKKFPQIPSISSINGLGYLFIGNGLKKKLLRSAILKMLKYAMKHEKIRVVFQNSDDQAVFTGSGTIPTDKTLIIPGSGVNTDDFSYTPEPQDKMQIVFPARLLHDKGIYTFISAARMLKEKGISARFILAGTLDPLNPTAATEEEVKKWQDEGIEWIGHCEDMAQLYQESNIICLPSLREGLSKSLLEALSCGRAIATTNTPGCNILVPEAHRDLLSPILNAEALANNLEELISNPELRKELGQWGRSQALKKYSIEAINAQTIALYKQMLHS